MKKNDRRAKTVRFRLARARYNSKRRSKKWKKCKKNNKISIQTEKIKKKRQARKAPKVFEAPKNFSLIDNTDEVLDYFNEAEKLLSSGENLILDISEVEVFTPSTIALLVASVKDPVFCHGSIINGNEPKSPDLARLFSESGFYEHVNSTRGFIGSKKGNLLHKEVYRTVVPDIARNATITGISHVFGSEKPFELLYEILIEAMSNTNDHANLHHQGKCNWWLYVYCDPKQKVTSYSFLDLGVGIFKSAVIQNYLKNLVKGTVLYKNINLVDDLLSGRIQSRVSGVDKEIRGKGIPQIVDHAKSQNFGEFYIISNDVKINLKTKGREQLKNRLNGTFLYWELKN